jgi:hypothetical protein
MAAHGLIGALWWLGLQVPHRHIQIPCPESSLEVPMELPSRSHDAPTFFNEWTWKLPYPQVPWKDFAGIPERWERPPSAGLGRWLPRLFLPGFTSFMVDGWMWPTFWSIGLGQEDVDAWAPLEIVVGMWTLLPLAGWITRCSSAVTLTWIIRGTSHHCRLSSGQGILAIWLVESESLFARPSRTRPPKRLHGSTFWEFWCQKFVR